MANLAHSTDCCASPRPAEGTSAETAADPVLAAVLAYREEESRISALPDPEIDDVPMPAWERLEKGQRLPAATTRDGAVEALRTAAEFHSHSTSRFFVANLMQAALGFLDGRATPEARIDAALAEIKAALAELYPRHFLTGHASLRVSTGAVVAGAYPEEGYEARLHFHADNLAALVAKGGTHV